MATALWVKTIRHHRTDRQATVPCGRADAHAALQDRAVGERVGKAHGGRAKARHGRQKHKDGKKDSFHVRRCVVFSSRIQR